MVIYNDGEGETYRDNFMDFYYEAQTREYLTETAGKYFDNPRIVVRIPRVPSAEGISPSTEFNEYITYKNNLVHAEITSETIDKEDAVDFLKELKDLGLRFSLSIKALSAGESYSGRYLEGYEEVYFERRKTE